ncbi:hypothetical protein H0H87_005653 [Tephrocybe sp. NHM501043]|nr:hypothetical protein H0H87_005653 [Tephrocybe sp. NHM501043]
MILHPEQLTAQALIPLIISCIDAEKSRIQLANAALLVVKFVNPAITSLSVFDNANAPTASSITSDIEGIMDCQVLHISDFKIDEPPSEHHSEVVLLYEKTTSGQETTLQNELMSLKLSDNLLLSHLEASQAVFDELGACASDLTWRRALKDSQGLNGNTTAENDSAPAGEQVQGCVKNWMFALPNLDPTSTRFNVSHKFLMLAKALESCQPYGHAFRGIILGMSIVFDGREGYSNMSSEVERRAVALAIADMLRMLDGPSIFFRPLYVAWNDISPTEHQDISRLFVTGAHNILIMPKLDKNAPTLTVSVVISFNAGCLDFGQNIGQAQTIIHMVRNSDDANPGKTLNRPLKCLTIECTDNIGPFTSIRDPTTGSCLYLGDSSSTVDRIMLLGQLNSVPSNDFICRYEEKEDAVNSGHIFNCVLGISGFTQITGPPRKTKADAKSAACFIFCQHLASIGLLDCRFFPPPKSLKTTPDDFGNQPNVKDQGPRRYWRKEPEFWPNTKNTEITMLYPIVISIPSDVDEPYAPIVILTRQPLPNLSSFNIFRSGAPTHVTFQRAEPLQMEDTRLNHLYQYTLRVCRTISNKPLECLPTDMVYFLAPLTAAWTSTKEFGCASPFTLPSIASFIPWDLVELAGNSYNMPLSMKDAEEEVHDAVIQDRKVEFTRRYNAVKLRRDLTPLSKPKDSPREAAFENILSYTKARKKGFTELEDIHQPLIEVDTIPAAINQLNPFSQPMLGKSLHAKYLIPELCSKSTLPASVMRTALLLPSITRRIDEFLLVKELNASLFEHKVSDVLLHMALSTPSSGAEYNYERLELLGDAFLKLLSSTYLFVTRPAHREGPLHDARQDLISNKSLYQCASHVGIPNYIQSKLFSVRTWTPPFFSGLPSASANKCPEPVKAEQDENTKKKKKKKRKRTSDETAVADVAEAMLAAGYLTSGFETALQVAKGLGIPLLGINTWSDFATSVAAPLSLVLKRDSLEIVKRIIGYEIKQPQLLFQALTHSSIVGHDSTLTERLEFLGDSVLDFMVVRHIYNREQQLTSGGLSLLKSAMVSNSALAAICVYSGLHEHFARKSHPLQTSIRDYVAKLEICREKEYQDAESEGRSPGQFWLEIAAPKVDRLSLTYA